jgi:antirestriction protein ArdC
MNRIDIYQSVTDRIATALEEGTVPWHQPWNDGHPFNIRTNRHYRGVNILLLGLQPYTDPRWGTFKAISESGGHVRKGEKGTWIILWKPVSKHHDGDDSDETYMLLRQYCVFNAEQADDLPEWSPTDAREHEPLEAAEMIVEGYENAPLIRFGGDRAFYQPSTDIVQVPEAREFESGDAYYSTLFHELVHSTGHEKRLKRIEPALFGSDPYAREELVAEVGASMLGAVAGIENAGGGQNAAYIAGWLKAVRNDHKLVVQAAAQAQKASDLILGETFEKIEQDVRETAGATA